MFWGTKKILRSACSELRAELDDHLDAINANTADAGELRETLGVLDEKIEKLASRIDELYLLLGAEGQLTSQESALQAFLQSPRTLTEVSSFLGDTAAASERLMRALFLKGVSVHTVALDGEARYTTNRAALEHVSLSRYFTE